MFSSLYAKTPPLLSPCLRKFHDLEFVVCANIIITRSVSSTGRNQKQLKRTKFTLSYLVNSCGLSPEEANSATRRVQFLSSKGPDSVLALFRTYGFSDSQITKTIKSSPLLLRDDPQKILCPKLKFFNSIGFTGPNLPKFLSSLPGILDKSLRNQIIHGHNFLKTPLSFDDEKVLKSMRKQSRFLLCDVKKIIAPNLLFLREIGMPQSVIQYLLFHSNGLLCYKVGKFHGKVKELIEMGFCPTKVSFVHAMGATIKHSESSWQHKIEVYGRCSWSKDEILSAFKVDPQCMIYSEKKIIDTMDFLVHVMDMKPSAVAASPYLFAFSLKKRIIPRGLVVKILMSKGVLENDISFYAVLQKTDEMFLNNYRYRQHLFEFTFDDFYLFIVSRTISGPIILYSSSSVQYTGF